MGILNKKKRVVNLATEICVSIVIVNYNTTDDIKKCIESIKACTITIGYEIIVADNCSHDRSIEKIKNEFTGIKLFLLDKNYGFGAGCNYGASKSKGKYFLFLNPDTIIENDTIDKMFYFLENNKNIGVCSVLMENKSDNIPYFYNSFPDLTWEFMEMTGFLHNKRIRKLYNDANENHSSESMEIDWAIGACLMIRREVFDLVKGFDEQFFLYYEDTDLQRRIRNEGYKVMLLNKLKIKHEGKSSIEENETGENTYYLNMHISKMKYYIKHFGPFNIFIIRLININAYILRLIKLPFRFQSISFKLNRFKIILKILNIYFSTKKTLLLR
jgi:GT2 family glycosyltransferase